MSARTPVRKRTLPPTVVTERNTSTGNSASLPILSKSLQYNHLTPQSLSISLWQLTCLIYGRAVANQFR